MIPNLLEARKESAARWQELPPLERTRIARLAAYVGVITLVFGRPLAQLVAHAGENSLHSHIPLVPIITAYLLYTRRGRAPLGSASVGGTLLFVSVGIAAVAAAFSWPERLSVNDYLALMALGYVSLLVAGGFLFCGASWMRASAFPVGFLIFIVPMPDGLAYWLERGSVLASADVSAWLFRVTGTPLLRDGTYLSLPGITLEVAQECSGIRSSWVLFITSLVASHVFLRSPWRRFVLVAFVVPLAIVRNSVRILVIGLLCVHVGPHMIDSVIHHRGGPIFFAISLIPLFMLLWWLYRQEHRPSGSR